MNFQTGHRLGSACLPAAAPLAKTPDGFSAVVGLINELGLFQAGLLRSFEFVLQVAEFVRPTALMGHSRPESSDGLGQTSLSIGGDQYQLLSLKAPVPEVP